VSASWTATVHVVPVAEGAWLHLTYDSSDGSHTSEFKGFDTAKNQWTHIWVAADGTRGQINSSAFMNDTMVFATKELDSEGHQIQTVFTKLSPTSYSHGDEAILEKTTKPIWKKICSKTN
jgi:hypothetical protein